MNRGDIQKLLGGYASGTLTPEEQQALFSAALEDQELFDALGREQALRDLLRDPAARAELLAVLDTPERGGFWKWMRSPRVGGLATVGVTAALVLAIGMVALWQRTRVKREAPAIFAELKTPEMKGPEMMAPDMKVPDIKVPDIKVQESKAREPKAGDAAVEVPAKRKTPPSSLRDATANNPPVLLTGRNSQALVVEDAKKEISASAAAAAAPAAEIAQGQPGLAGAVDIQTAAPQAPSLFRGASPSAPLSAPLNAPRDKLTLDARSLFYGNSSAPRKDATAVPAENQRKITTSQMRAAGGNLAKPTGAISSLGVRVSMMRGDQEAAVTTILDPGERVRFKLVPNEDGFLYVATRDGNVWKMVASAPAQRLKPFETPPLLFEDSGQKQVYVMLSRQAQTALSPQSMAGLVRANLVETVTDQDLATYVVAGLQTIAPQEVVQPITLTYR